MNKDFGKGWLTKSARDLVRILILVAGYRSDDLLLEITRLQGKREGMANVATVLRAAQNLLDAARRQATAEGDR